jgi:peptide-methionine (S)-S-oxide reductase
MIGEWKVLSASTIVVAILLFVGPAFWNPANAADASGLPDPAVDAPLAVEKGKETIVVAGGCFWGVQAVFQHVKGVKDAISGYAGGSVRSPSYEHVSTGETGHAESVKITHSRLRLVSVEDGVSYV